MFECPICGFRWGFANYKTEITPCFRCIKAADEDEKALVEGVPISAETDERVP